MTIFEKKPDFTLFLQTLSWEIDDQVGIEVRNELLREVGRGMGTRIMPPPCQTVDKLQIELNALLALIGWGTVTLELLSEDQSLRIVHENLPQVGSAGEPSGTWLAPVLEGLYGRWVTSQAGAFGDYVVTRDVDAEDLNAVPRQTIIMHARAQFRDLRQDNGGLVRRCFSGRSPPAMLDDAMASGTTAGSRAWQPGHSVSGWSGFLLSGGMWGLSGWAGNTPL